MSQLTTQRAPALGVASSLAQGVSPDPTPLTNDVVGTSTDRQAIRDVVHARATGAEVTVSEVSVVGSGQPTAAVRESLRIESQRLDFEQERKIVAELARQNSEQVQAKDKVIASAPETAPTEEHLSTNRGKAQVAEEEQESSWMDTVWGVAKATASFAQDLSSSLGVTQIAKGAVHAVAAVPHLAYDLGKAVVGQGSVSEAVSNLGGHLKGVVGNGVVGAVTLVGEVSGITDALQAGRHGIMAVGSLVKGDTSAALSHLGQAGMHAAFAAASAGAIAATVVTGGAAVGAVAGVAMGRVALREATEQVTKVAAKEFLEAGAKEIAEKAVQTMGSEAIQLVSQETLQQIEQAAVRQVGADASQEVRQALVDKMALEHVLKREGAALGEEGAKGVAADFAKRGATALESDAVQATLRDLSEKRTKELLEKLKLTDAVDESTFKMLTDVSQSNSKAAVKTLSETYGVSVKDAEAMVAQLKAGRSDAAMKQILEDGITKRVSDVIHENMEHSFKASFKEGVSKELGDAVTHQLDEVTEAAWKGAKEGAETATRRAVREGLEQAFKRFRDRSLDRSGVVVSPDLDEEEHLTTQHHKAEGGKVESREKSSLTAAEEKPNGTDEVVVIETALGNGRKEVVELARSNPSTGYKKVREYIKNG